MATEKIGQAVVAAAVVLAAGSAQAVIVLSDGQSVNLAALMAAGSDRKVAIDDKVFTLVSFGSSTMSAANVTFVARISASTNEWGLHDVGFDLTGQFGDFSPNDSRMAEMNLRYQVAVAPSAYANDVRLCDTELLFDGASSGTGSFARVDETVLDLDANRFLGTLSAFDIAGPPRKTRLADAIDFCDRYGSHGYRAFEVNKDIKFFAAGSGSAEASFVRQQFSQVMAPAPGAVALLAAAGAVGRHRRRR